jgi:hypothetical protein
MQEVIIINQSVPVKSDISKFYEWYRNLRNNNEAKDLIYLFVFLKMMLFHFEFGKQISEN